LTGSISSFTRLSLNPAFQRQWHSLYKAVEQGTVRADWLSCYLAQQVPQTGIQYFSLDSSSWARPRARDPLPQAASRLDHAPVPPPRHRKPLELAGGPGGLAAVPLSPDCLGLSFTLAETSEQADPSTRAAKLAFDFCTVWLSCQEAENAWKITGVASRQAQNAKTALRVVKKQPTSV
jgi:hypothetical protein